MKCPFCSFNKTRVTDSRTIFKGLGIRRRRVCPKCKARFSSREVRELASFVVLKKDGWKESYNREKLEGGIRKALEKRPIAESEDEVQQLILEIERDITNPSTLLRVAPRASTELSRMSKSRGKEQRHEIPSALIGKTVLKHLKARDPVAYLRFASVYLDFKSLKGFDKEIKKLIKR